MRKTLLTLFCLLTSLLMTAKEVDSDFTTYNTTTSGLKLTPMGTVVGYAGDIEITGTVTNTLSTAIENGFKLGLDYQGETFTQEFNIPLAGSQKYEFTLDKKLRVESNQTVSYAIWIEHNGEKVTLEQTLSAYIHRVIIEESTGGWCGFCPRGILAMEKMNEKYPDTFIGIAVHNRDVMQNNYYNTEMEKVNSGGYPKSIASRYKIYSGDPSNMEAHYTSVRGRGNNTGIEIKATLDQETKVITADTKVFFADSYSNANYALTYVLIENNVHKPGDNSYNQANYYAGGGYGAMGGFENKDNPIKAKDIYYQEVARYIGPDFYGVEGSIPAKITAFEAIEHHSEHNISNITVLDYEELEFIAILLNKSTGRIQNVAKVSLSSGTSIRQVNATPLINIRSDRASIYLETTETIKSAKLIALDGSIVASMSLSVNGAYEISRNGRRGVYVIQIQSSMCIFIYKVNL